MTAQNASEKKPDTRTKTQKIIHEVVVTGLLVLGVLAFRSTVASTYRVPTGSMIPTILPGDHFFASQMAYNFRIPFTETSLTEFQPPKLGDIIVFPSPVEPDINLVKRVVAVGGDTLEVRNGRLIRNGKEVVYDPAEGSNSEFDSFWENLEGRKHYVQYDKNSPNLRMMPQIQIPKDCFFPMGDNRDHSADGRIFGPVPIEKLRARAWRIFFSLDSSMPFLRIGRTGQLMI